MHLVSDGGTRPYRVHVRDPGFVNLQSASAMCEGSLIADAIAASLPVVGAVASLAMAARVGSSR